MKEKTKKILNTVLSYKGAAWLNFALSVMFLFFAIFYVKVEIAILGTPHLLYAGLFCMLHIERNESVFWKDRYLSWRCLAESIAEQCHRYKELYGDLPKEETKEEQHDTNK